MDPVKNTRGADWGAELLQEALQVAQEPDGYSSLDFQLDSNVSLSTPTAPQSVNVHSSDEVMNGGLPEVRPEASEIFRCQNGMNIEISADTNHSVVGFHSSTGPAQTNVALSPSCSLNQSTLPTHSGIKSAQKVMGCGKWTASRQMIQQEQSSESPRLFALWNNYYNAEKEAVAQHSKVAVGEIHAKASPSRQSQFPPSRIKRPPRRRTKSRHTRLTESYLKFVSRSTL
ncbi:unnamed protein product [Rodentolepis nana]|uniref:HMG box domain-containing protein n=1 Tax=Rodentolepis nana TaxID=102285 RepID=A0A0R3T1U8_RODNA|nr:unnamed protein product [Rodentolepis nana]